MAVVGSTLQGRAEAREALYRRYRSKIVPNGELDRTLVSFQANRKRSFYRWLKYKEAFSAKFGIYH